MPAYSLGKVQDVRGGGDVSVELAAQLVNKDFESSEATLVHTRSAVCTV